MKMWNEKYIWTMFVTYTSYMLLDSTTGNISNASLKDIVTGPGLFSSSSAPGSSPLGSARKGIDADEQRLETMESSRTSPAWVNSANTTLYEGFNTYTWQQIEQECQMSLTNFAYKRDICGAPDVSSYLQSAKVQYTCAERCGLAPRFGEAQDKDCACDVLCSVYGDCCRDVASICPQTHAQSRDLQASLPAAETRCSTLTSTVVQRAKDSNRHGTEQSTSTPIVTVTSTGVPHTQTYFPWTLLPRKAKPLDAILLIDNFIVADLKTGILFENLSAIRSWNLPLSGLAFVPKTVAFECPDGTLATPYGGNAARVIPSCKVIALKDVQTRLHRNCPHPLLVSCVCRFHRTSKYIVDRLQDTCQGLNNSDSLFQRLGLEEGEHTAMRDSPQKVGDCISYYPTEKAMYNDLPKSSWTMRATPVLTSLRAIDSERFLGRDSHPTQSTTGADASERDCGGSEDNMLKVVPMFEYVLEFMSSLERRVRCSTLTRFPSQCRVERCVSGAILSSNHIASGQTGHQLCILPVRVVVHPSGPEDVLPLCACLRVLVALGNLRLWNFRFRFRDGKCTYHLIVLSQELPLPEVYMFDIPGVPSPSAATMNVSTLWQQIHSTLNAVPVPCPVDEISVCFHFHGEAGTSSAGAEAALCKNLSVASTMRTSQLHLRSKNVGESAVSKFSETMSIVCVTVLLLPCALFY